MQPIGNCYGEGDEIIEESATFWKVPEAEMHI